MPSRRTSSSGEAATNALSPRPAQKTKQEPNAERRTPKTAAASWRRRRVDGDLAREHDLLERARADPLDGARDRLDVVLGRRDAGDPEAPGGRRVEQRELAVAQRGHARGHPLGELLGDVVGRGERRHGERDLAVAARQRHLGHDERAGAEAGPVRRRAAVGREREAADRDEPGAGRPVVLARDRPAGERAPGGGHLARSARARSPRAASPSRARRRRRPRARAARSRTSPRRARAR